MPNYAKGATGAFGGARTGAKLGSVIPGVGNVAGGVVGGIIGGLGGLFGKRRRKPDQEKPDDSAVSPQLTNALGQFQNRATMLLGQDPRSSAYHNAARGQLLDFIRRQTQSDAAQAASRGLTGTEFEIAQAARRQGVQADQERQSLASAERFLRADQEAALRQLLQGLGLQQSGLIANRNHALAQQQRSDAQNAGLRNTFSEIVQAVPSIIQELR